jgi:arsenate reductase (thioredoxin)
VIDADADALAEQLKAPGATEPHSVATEESVLAADVVVTMGCGDACPVFPGKRYLDWELPDPAGKTLEEVRPIRDEIDRRVRQLLDELVGTAA